MYRSMLFQYIWDSRWFRKKYLYESNGMRRRVAWIHNSPEPWSDHSWILYRSEILPRRVDLQWFLTPSMYEKSPIHPWAFQRKEGNLTLLSWIASRWLHINCYAHRENLSPSVYFWNYNYHESTCRSTYAHTSFGWYLIREGSHQLGENKRSRNHVY